MEFDINNVKFITGDTEEFNIANLIGCKGYFSSSLIRLKRYVEDEDSDFYDELTGVNDSQLLRNAAGEFYMFFYPVENKSCMNKLNFIRRCIDNDDLKYPALWLKHTSDGDIYLVNIISNDSVTINCFKYTYEELSEYFTFVNGKKINEA